MERLIVVLLLTATLGACVPAGDFCGVVVEPGRFSDATIDAMSENEVDWVLAINRYGARHCGWRP